jgi:hypothetical protein
MCVGDYLSEELSVRFGLVAWMSGPWAWKEISKEEINTNLETILPTHYVSVLGWLLVCCCCSSPPLFVTSRRTATARRHLMTELQTEEDITRKHEVDSMNFGAAKRQHFQLIAISI